MLIREFPREAARSLFLEARKIQKVSMKRTPVETGVLRASHDTEKPTQRAGLIETKITVGGAASAYAVPVHFRDELKHRVGQARFLESALNDARSQLALNIAASIKKMVARKVRKA